MSRNLVQSKTEFSLIIKDLETGLKMKFLNLIFQNQLMGRQTQSSDKKYHFWKRKWVKLKTKSYCWAIRYKKFRKFITQNRVAVQENCKYQNEQSRVIPDRASLLPTRTPTILSKTANQWLPSSLNFRL